jgi:hypothetical protein
MNFNALPKECFELICDFSSINWKRRFTLNVLPYIKTIHTVGVANEQCASCYIDGVVAKAERCMHCQTYNQQGDVELTFQEFKKLDSNAFRLAKRVKATSYQAFKHWCIGADRFYGFGLNMQIRTEYLRREFVRDMQTCTFDI